MGSRLLARFPSVQHAKSWMERLVAETNVLYRRQLGVVLQIGHFYFAEGADANVPWDNPSCARDISWQLGQFQDWTKPTALGLWHLFDACWTGQGQRTTAGLATTGAIC